MAYQGSLDGLCGPYAIVNAYHLCDIDEDWLGQDIFEIACSTLTGWPDVLWEGTSFHQMRMMVRACQDALSGAYEENGVDYPVTRWYPFYNLLIHEALQGCRDATYEPSRFPVAVPYPSPHRSTPAYVVVTSSDLDTSRNKASVSGLSWISRFYNETPETNEEYWERFEENIFPGGRSVRDSRNGESIKALVCIF